MRRIGVFLTVMLAASISGDARADCTSIGAVYKSNGVICYGSITIDWIASACDTPGLHLDGVRFQCANGQKWAIACSRWGGTAETASNPRCDLSSERVCERL